MSDASRTQSDDEDRELINSEEEDELVNLDVNTKLNSPEKKKCPYHSFTRSTIDHNSPAPDNNRFDFTSLIQDETGKSLNVSYHLMFNKDAFNK